MGTNGAVVYVVDGERKEQYVHNDSYPESLGVRLLKWLRKSWDDPATYEAVSALKPIPPNAPDPTPAEQQRLAKYADLNVSNRSLADWYCLLRECQGEPALTLEAGYVYGEGGIGFFTYTIDFDAKTFTVDGYGDLTIACWPFNELPKTKRLLKATIEDEDS